MKLKCLLGGCSLLLMTPGYALTLTEAVIKGLEFNPTVKSLEMSVDMGEARLAQMYGSYHPTVSLQMEGGSTRSTGDEWRHKIKSSLILSQVVYDFGRISNLVDNRKHKLNASQQTLHDGRERLALLITKTFLEILKLQQVIGHVDQNIAFYKRFLDILLIREAAGASGKSDVQRLTSLGQNAELELIQYKTDLTFARRTFKSLTGIEAENLMMPMLDDLVIEQTPETLVNFAITRSYQVLALNESVEAAKKDWDKAKSDLYPTINLRLEANKENSLETDREWKSNGAGIVSVNYDLWDGRQARRKVDEAYARVMQAEYRKSEAILSQEKKVQEAYSSMLKLQDEKAVNNEALSTNKEIVELYYKEFELGEKTLLDITTAQADYHTSQVQSAALQFDYYKSMLDIRFYLNEVINTIRSLEDS